MNYNNMQYLELKDGAKIAFSEHYQYDGVNITIEQPVTDEQMVEIRKKLNSERDLLSLTFMKRK